MSLHSVRSVCIAMRAWQGTCITILSLWGDAGNLYDANDDGISSSDEGLSARGVLVAADFSSDGGGGGGFFLDDVAAVATHVRGIGVDATTVRLAWRRGGVNGTLATMYKVESQLVQDGAGSAGGRGGEWTQAQIVAASAVVVEQIENDGRWKLSSETDLQALSGQRGCCDIVASTPRGRSAIGSLGTCSALPQANTHSCAMTFSQVSGGGVQYGDAVYAGQTGDRVYLMYSHAQSILGTPLSPLTAVNVTAHVGLLMPDAEYRLRVRSANLNQAGFETRGSDIVTVVTVGRPAPVTTLQRLYMSGDNGVQLVWQPPEGGTYCGEVVYRLFRQSFAGASSASGGSWSNVWLSAHAGYLSAPPAEGIYVNVSSGIGEGLDGVSRAKFVVCSYCQAHLAGTAALFRGCGCVSSSNVPVCECLCVCVCVHQCCIGVDVRVAIEVHA